MRGNLIVFATRSMREYAEEVVRSIRASRVDLDSMVQGELTVTRFADGEMEAEIGTSVRGRDVFLFAGASRNRAGLSAEECKIEMYNAVDALRRAQAGRITLFEPYCSPGRSDRLTRRNSVGLWVHFKILMSLGIDHYITFQLHSEKSKTFIDPRFCDVDDIPAQVLLQKFICDRHVKTRKALSSQVKRDWVFCSVDAGGEGFARRFAASFGTKLIISQKQRDYSTSDTVESINILTSEPVEGKSIWIVDDQISTAHSVDKLTRALEKLKPGSINMAVVHPVFSGPALERLSELCERKLVKTILVTDTISCDDGIRKKLPCLSVVPSVGLAADIVLRLNSEQPLSPLLAPFNAYDYLKE